MGRSQSRGKDDNSGYAVISGCQTKPNPQFPGIKVGQCGELPVQTKYFAQISQFATFTVVKQNPEPTRNPDPRQGSPGSQGANSPSSPKPSPSETRTTFPPSISSTSVPAAPGVIQGASTNLNPSQAAAITHSDTFITTANPGAQSATVYGQSTPVPSPPGAVSSSAATGHNSAAVVAAAVLGTLVALIAFAVGLRCYMRRRRRAATRNAVNGFNMPRGLLAEDSPSQRNDRYPGYLGAKGDDMFSAISRFSHVTSGSSFTTTTSTESTAEEEKHTFRLNFPH